MTKSSSKLVTLYILFAGLSTLLNITSQIVSMSIYKGTYAIEISILVGTLFGLPLRYFLEKRYIFSFKSKNLSHDGQLFILYSLMGVFTTVIFWGSEYVFHKLFHTDYLRYLGGVLGLSLGFYIKYMLDRKFVFINPYDKKLD
jgi:putative flippase GtrA